ncbi:MAG: AAA family ATPase, partial [Verrucomicrobiae bacterium]|nr:AAA family ATPase [Verrucomicrobiae bacterium]
AQTVAHFLTTKKELPKNAVVIIDEAGQIGGRQMSALFAVLKKNESRIILSGDTRQHGAVEASDALRAIEKHAGLKPAELSAIRRQDPNTGKDVAQKDFIGRYRKAVKAASEGKLIESYERLDSLGCVLEIESGTRKETLAKDYVCALNNGEKALVVTQTWDEIHRVNQEIQKRLRDEEKLGDGKQLSLFENRDLDNAQKQDARYYADNDYVIFMRKYGRFEKGDLAKIESVGPQGICLNSAGKSTVISLRKSERFVVARKRSVELSPGDRLQLKFNGSSLENKPIVNGELVTIEKINDNGRITVREDGGAVKTLSPDQRLVNLGYAVTSYSSQGKTVDTLLFSDSQCKAATNRNQWYVSISRARKRIKIYTSDKEALRENILRIGERPLAMDLVSDRMGQPVSIKRRIEKSSEVSRRAMLLAKTLMLSMLKRGTWLPRAWHHLRHQTVSRMSSI